MHVINMFMLFFLQKNKALAKSLNDIGSTVRIAFKSKYLTLNIDS